MKPSTTPTIPPALRKARPRKEISDAFPPIVARPRPVASIPPTPSVTGEPTLPVSAPSPSPAPAAVPPQSSAPAQTPKTHSPAPSTLPAGAATVSAALGKPSVKPNTTPTTISAPVVNVSQPVKPLTRPKPTFKGRPPVAELEGREVVFEGSFLHEEHPPFVIETRLTGNAASDKGALITAARKKYPTGAMQLKSTRIFTRESGAQQAYPKGASVGQLFGAAGTPTENAVELGSVFWGGEKCQVMLVNLRSRSSVTINLRGPGAGKIAFSNQIPATTPATGLKAIVKEVLGNDARGLHITVKIDS